MAAGQPADLLSQENSEWHHKTKCLVFRVTLASAAANSPSGDRTHGQTDTGSREAPKMAKRFVTLFWREKEGRPVFPVDGEAVITSLPAKRPFLTSPPFKLLFLFYFTCKAKPHQSKKPSATAPFACHLLANSCIWLRWGQSIIFSTTRNIYRIKDWQKNQ